MDSFADVFLDLPDDDDLAVSGGPWDLTSSKGAPDCDDELFLSPDDIDSEGGLTAESAPCVEISERGFLFDRQRLFPDGQNGSYPSCYGLRLGPRGGVNRRIQLPHGRLPFSQTFDDDDDDSDDLFAEIGGGGRVDDPGEESSEDAVAIGNHRQSMSGKTVTTAQAVLREPESGKEALLSDKSPLDDVAIVEDAATCDGGRPDATPVLSKEKEAAAQTSGGSPSLAPKGKKRGSYNCSKCGMPKKGHTCATVNKRARINAFDLHHHHHHHHHHQQQQHQQEPYFLRRNEAMGSERLFFGASPRRPFTSSLTGLRPFQPSALFQRSKSKGGNETADASMAMAMAMGVVGTGLGGMSTTTRERRSSSEMAGSGRERGRASTPYIVEEEVRDHNRPFDVTEWLRAPSMGTADVEHAVEGGDRLTRSSYRDFAASMKESPEVVGAGLGVGRGGIGGVEYGLGGSGGRRFGSGSHGRASPSWINAPPPPPPPPPLQREYARSFHPCRLLSNRRVFSDDSGDRSIDMQSSPTSSWSSTERYERALAAVGGCMDDDIDGNDMDCATSGYAGFSGRKGVHVIPDSCLLRIFSKLPPSGLIAASLACRRWRQASLRVWAAVREMLLTLRGPSCASLVGENARQTRTTPREYVPLMLQHCPDLSILSLAVGSRIDDSMLDMIAISSPQLLSLEIHVQDGGVNSITGQGLSLFVEQCPYLRCLKVDGCGAVTAIDLSSARLSTLWLSGCHRLAYMNIDCPFLSELALDLVHPSLAAKKDSPAAGASAAPHHPFSDPPTREEALALALTALMRCVAKCCNSLVRLHVASPLLQDSAVLALLSGDVRDLRALSLIHGQGITNESAAVIATKCENIELLDLSGASISDKGLAMLASAFSTSLCRLLVSLCGNLTMAGIRTSAMRLPNLRLLDCGRVLLHESIGVASSAKDRVEQTSERSSIDVNGDWQGEGELGGGGEDTSKWMGDGRNGKTKLRGCGLKGRSDCHQQKSAERMSDLREQQEDASVETLMKDDDFMAMDDEMQRAACLPGTLWLKNRHLQHLSLWGCSGIQGLALDCPQLMDLNLSSCRNLQPGNLVLRCPSLKNVFVPNCDKAAVQSLRYQANAPRRMEEANRTLQRQADGTKRVQAARVDLLQEMICISD